MSNSNTESDSQKVYEEPEGLDLQMDKGFAYPLDSLLIRPEQRTVYEIMRRIDKKAYILDPDFQRDFVWKEDRQSRLIESVLMRIPLPVFYLAEQDSGKIIVVDGLQRLMTFRRYLKDEFSLKIPKSKLNGKKFSSLPQQYQARIEDTNLIVYLIDSKVPERARLDIFERVNSGIPLSRQQMRNSLNNGPATRWLKKQALSEIFLAATDGSLNPKTMRDREVINRFCGFFLLGYTKYSDDMDDFLASTLVYMNQFDEAKLNELETTFLRSMKNNLIIFGKHSFRKHNSVNSKRSVINIALFDVMSCIMTKYSTDFVKKHATQFQQKFYILMNNPTFLASITLATNDLPRVLSRFELAEEIFTELKE